MAAVNTDLLLDSTILEDDRPTRGDWHCPGQVMMEMQATATMKILMEMTIEKIAKMQAEMLAWVKIPQLWSMAVILPVILPIIGLVKIPQMQNVVQIMEQIISQMLNLGQIILQVAAIIMLWKILCFMMEMTIQMKAQTAHLSRSEYNTSALGGWGMRLLDASLLISRSISRTW